MIQELIASVSHLNKWGITQVCGEHIFYDNYLCFTFSLCYVINNYSTKWRWIVVDIYQATQPKLMLKLRNTQFSKLYILQKNTWKNDIQCRSENMLGYNVLDNVFGHCLLIKAHSFLELCSQKTVLFSEQIMGIYYSTNCNTVQIWSWFSQYLSSIGNRYPAIYVILYAATSKTVNKRVFFLAG